MVLVKFVPRSFAILLHLFVLLFGQVFIIFAYFLKSFFFHLLSKIIENDFLFRPSELIEIKINLIELLLPFWLFFFVNLLLLPFYIFLLHHYWRLLLLHFIIPINKLFYQFLELLLLSISLNENYIQDHKNYLFLLFFYNMGFGYFKNKFIDNKITATMKLTQNFIGDLDLF